LPGFDRVCPALTGFDRVKINARNKGVKALPKHRFAFGGTDKLGGEGGKIQTPAFAGKLPPSLKSYGGTSRQAKLQKSSITSPLPQTRAVIFLISDLVIFARRAYPE
jgi:hypothetical protein